jgi:branched-chain amino acid transport system substrate-binding protein
VRRQDTFGFVGPLDSGSVLFSAPVLNRAAMVQISPSNTDPPLTSPATRAVYQPATYHHRLAYLTYYRVITTDILQGPSIAAFLRYNLHAGTYFQVDDNSAYGSGLAGEVEAYALKIGLQPVGHAHLDTRSSSRVATSATAISAIIAAKHPDGVFFGGANGPGGILLKDLRQQGYTGPLMGGDGIHNPVFLRSAGNAAVNSYATELGLDISATSRAFRQAYRARFHVAQEMFDAYAYDAANIELHAVFLAATQGRSRANLRAMREAVLPRIAGVHWHGATGMISFDRNGDNAHPIISVYATRARRWVYVGVAPRVVGVSPTG